ncbi:MAG: leucine-rich repeat domain-containing protein [Pseudomonadota bacterium]
MPITKEVLERCAHIGLLLTLLLLSWSAPLEANELKQAERDALIALYDATDGDNWTNNDGWLGEPGTECGWRGISCDTGEIIRIRLDDNGLSGELPAELAQLSKLSYLSLGGNQLTGSIPPDLGQLSSLRFLWLPRNQLTGSIPPELGQLSALKYLNLFGNQLTGSIPTELGQLASLELLNIWGSQLTGAIPPELGQLSKLRSLSLGGNQLTGSIPPDLGQLSSLDYLRLPGNELTGSIPSELAQLSSLTVMQLANNQLTGTIPPELGQLSELTSLMLWNNQLSGTIPSELEQLSALELLNLSNNQLIGDVPAGLDQLPDLRFFDVSGNLFGMTGSNPIEVNIIDGDRTVADNDGALGEVVVLEASATSRDSTIINTDWVIEGEVVASGLTADVALPDGATEVFFHATDNDGDTSTTSVTIIVLPPNEIDTTPPQFISWDVSPKVVDTRSEARVFVTIRVKDDYSGVLSPIFSLSRWDRYYDWVSSSLISGTSLDGIWEARIRVPVGSDPDVWTIFLSRLEDKQGNSYLPDQEEYESKITVVSPLQVQIAGGNRTINDSDGVAGESVWLNAEVTDLDGNWPTYEWLIDGTTVATSGSAKLNLPDGETTVTLHASDDEYSSTSSVTITVEAPVWPGPFNGVAPDPVLSLPLNNIGVLDRSTDRLYSCVRFLMNGQQSQFDGFERMDITFDVLPGDELTLKVLEVRAFNPDNALTASSELPDCSGTFELSTEVYSDTIERDGAVFRDEFELVDGAQLIFGVRDSQVVRPPSPFNGVMPDPALELPFNNIGILDRPAEKVYSCVRFLMNGQQSQFDGFERMGITFVVLPGEELALQVLEARAFNPSNALTESQELPDCSGTFEMSTEVYSDTIERDGTVFNDEFNLIDGAQLIFGVRDSQEVMIGGGS